LGRGTDVGLGRGLDIADWVLVEKEEGEGLVLLCFGYFWLCNCRVGIETGVVCGLNNALCVVVEWEMFRVWLIFGLYIHGC
jgi:hypothetical protein